MSSSYPDQYDAMGNPVIPVYAADPHAEIFGDRYYIYATNSGIYSSAKAFHEKHKGEEHGFAAWSSTNLRHWKNEGRILRFTDIDWAKGMGDAWAPCMAERNGRFYFYFCADSRIGVAVGDSPTGPFHDTLGRPLVDFREDLSSIDPMVFIDDDGQAYCYWGAIPGIHPEKPNPNNRQHLTVRRLKADMVTFEGEELPTIWTAVGWHSLNHLEASHVFKRDGIYYLMWSPGDFASDDESRAYRVHYATSSSPLGPWKEAVNNPVLSTRREIGVVGPGHHSTIQIPGTDDWYCVYHCHKGDSDRRTFIDRMTFDARGNIETIVPTLEGPPPHRLHLELVIAGKGPYRSSERMHMAARIRDQAIAGVQCIEFFSGSNKIGESAAGSLGFEWKDAQIGFHRLTTRITSTSGQTMTSAPRNVDMI